MYGILRNYIRFKCCKIRKCNILVRNVKDPRQIFFRSKSTRGKYTATERTPRQTGEERQDFESGTRIVSREQRRWRERRGKRQAGP